ncbi:MAG: SET domain-containing protein-lysine N-methyltransferase [Gemmataceae bacterium]
MLEIRDAGEKGRGLFARAAFAEGAKILDLGGTVRSTEELTDDVMALQIGIDRWLCSAGEHLDDFANHSCEPNAGFITGELALFALRDISPGEEITWDYSTSLDEPGWTLDCRCGTDSCRRTIRPWSELSEADRHRLRDMAIEYLRDRQ